MVDTAHNYTLELHYTTIPTGHTAMAHVLRMFVRVDAEVFPGETFDSVGLITWNGLDQTLEDITDGFMVGIIPFYPATTTFNRWELWKSDYGSADRVWIATKEIGDNGTHVGTSRPAGQVIFSFRCSDGKYMKLYIMESCDNSDIVTPPPYSGIYLDLANDIKNILNSYVTRYNARPLANLKISSGQNEEVFKKRFR